MKNDRENERICNQHTKNQQGLEGTETKTKLTRKDIKSKE